MQSKVDFSKSLSRAHLARAHTEKTMTSHSLAESGSVERRAEIPDFYRNDLENQPSLPPCASSLSDSSAVSRISTVSCFKAPIVMRAASAAT